MTYDESVEWLYASQLHGIKLGLENIRRLASALGVAAGGADSPMFFHVAGTNGKGSVCAMLDAVCRAYGIRTGLFTSPHLVTFRERIKLDGRLISEEDVARGVTRIRALTAEWDHAATFFEITTALALEWFQGHGARVVILETGMGGRLDATNLVAPGISIITPIALDHQEWLGNTLREIAFEKAGIIKQGTPIVSAPQEDEVASVLKEVAEQREAPLEFVTEPPQNLKVNLEGEHQKRNAALAIRALSLAGLAIPDSAVQKGLEEVEWPGRFQALGERFILDGAHNPAAARMLADTWRAKYGEKRATLILGILRDKDVRGICEALLPIAGRILAVPVQSPRSAATQQICKSIGELAPRQECIAVRDLPGAIRIASSMERRALITGSLFLVGEALAYFSQSGGPERSAQ